LGDTLQSYDKALKNYLHAHKLGSVTVCRKLGDMYFFGNLGNKDMKKALEYYEYSVEYGNLSCYGNMMIIYISKNNIVNALKCWEFYNQKSNQIEPRVANEYILLSWNNNLPIKHRENLLNIKNKIINFQQQKYKCSEKNHSEMFFSQLTYENIYKDFVAYTDYILSSKLNELIIPGQDYKKKRNEEKSKRKSSMEQLEFELERRLAEQELAKHTLIEILIKDINNYIDCKFPKDNKIIKAFGFNRYINIKVILDKKEQKV